MYSLHKVLHQHLSLPSLFRWLDISLILNCNSWPLHFSKYIVHVRCARQISCSVQELAFNGPEHYLYLFLNNALSFAQREQMRLHQLAVEMQLTPFLILLRHTMDALDEKDVGSIFALPVSTEEVCSTDMFTIYPLK